MAVIGAKAGWRWSVSVLAVAAIIPAADTIAASTRSSTVDPKLVGKWTHTVTKADVKRAPGALILLAGKTATIVVAKSGHYTLDEGFGGGLGKGDGTIAPAGANRVHITLSGEEFPPNLYTWRVSGRTLTLTKLKDSNPNMVAVFWGVWKRK